MERPAQIRAIIVILFYLGAFTKASKSFNIGGILHSNESQQHFSKAVKKINFDGESVAGLTTLYDVSVILHGSPITTASQVCDTLIAKGVHSIVVASPRGNLLTTVAISYLSSFYHIPIICTHSRDSAFSDKNIHSFFLRTVPPYSHQADVWVALLKYLNYRRVIFIHSSDTNGRSLHSRFQTLAQLTQNDEGIKLTSVIEFNPGEESFVEELNSIKDELVKVILLYANVEDAETILHDASYLNMTGSGYVWLVTEQALDAWYVPVGALGFKLKHAEDLDAHITDSLRMVALGLRHMYEQDQNISEPPTSCDSKDGWEETGKNLFESITQQVIYDGETGKVAFDSRGDRIFAEYTLMNVRENKRSFYGVNDLQTVGEFSYDRETDEIKPSLNLSSIVWPGGDNEVPQGYILPTHFRVMTLQEKPFVYAEPVDSPDECGPEDEALCPFFNTTSNTTQLMCCWGYCIDLLFTLATKNNFTFSVELSPDSHYGVLKENAQGKKEWTGVIGQLANEVNGVDMVAAPLTINPERSDAIAFSKPFKYQGITILVKRVPHEPALVSILQPFRDTLWFMLLATVHVIAVVVWLLDRLSPVYKMTGSETDSLALSESFWFSWGVILNSGLTDGTPRCLSGRVLGIIWGGFAMIMVASYTANLAAFLVLDSPVTAISGISDPRLRNPVENYTFATIRGSAVDMFFRRKTEWSNMYRVMETNNYDTVDEALAALREGTLQAFIWESSRLEYEASQDCNLVTVGELFGRSGYGLGLKKGSPWAEKITIDILDLHERGYMEELDKTWIWNNEVTCSEDLLDENFSKRLGLKNLEGIFIMVAGGILSGIILVTVEISYNRCKTKMTDQEVKNAAQASRHGEEISEGRKGAVTGDRTQVASEKYREKGVPGTNRGDTDSSRISLGIASTSPAHTGTRSKCPTTGEDHELNDSDASYVNSRIMLHDIEDRLRRSPNIPEEWKTRTPLQWLEYYSDILQEDSQTAVELAEAREARAAMGELMVFVRERGIEDFSQLYEIGVQDTNSQPYQGVNSGAEGNDCGNTDEKVREGNASEQKSHHVGNVLDQEPLGAGNVDQLKLFRQQLEKLPDVLDNCSERGTCLNEEEECECTKYTEDYVEFGLP